MENRKVFVIVFLAGVAARALGGPVGAISAAAVTAAAYGAWSWWNRDNWVPELPVGLQQPGFMPEAPENRPGQVPRPAPQNELAIGIDLGTTYSCVGVWRRQHNDVAIIDNERGDRTTPSYVAFTGAGPLVGEDAVNHAALDPANTVFDAKRLIGGRFSSQEIQSNLRMWPFRVIAGRNDVPLIVVQDRGQDRQCSPEVISTIILTKLRQMAEAYTGYRVTSAVITVPPYFDEPQILVTREAGERAGLNVVAIIEEPIAAWSAYHHRAGVTGSSQVRNVLIFDLGGGTLDVSLLNIADGIPRVQAHTGDRHLGGRDFDNRMVNHFVQEFRQRENTDISVYPAAMSLLRKECERAKRRLSFTTRTRIDLPNLLDGINFSLSITRTRFEELNMDLFLRCITCVRNCLFLGKIDKNSIDNVVMVGGSTRIPMVEQLLRDFFNRTELLLKDISPEEAVAHGATFQAGRLGARIG